MESRYLKKCATNSAIALALGVSGIANIALANTTLTFTDNTTPSATPPFDPTVSGGSNSLPFAASTEFRVVTSSGTATNDGHKDAIFGGEQWIFDASGSFIGVKNTPTNPGSCQVSTPSLCQAPITLGVTGFPICKTPGSCPTLHQSAPFLGVQLFNYLAPIVGSEAENAYGVGTISIDATANTISVFFPVTNVQWADGNYINGADPNVATGDKFIKGAGPGVTIAGNLSNPSGTDPLIFDFRIYGEHRMLRDEVTVAGFKNNITQWELPGSVAIDNLDPVASNDGGVNRISVLSGVSTNINVLANDVDPDWELLNSQAFDKLQVFLGDAACTNGGMLVDNDVNAIYTSAPGFTGPDDCTYSITDGRGGISNIATVFLSVTIGGVPPTANDDGPGDTPGGPYATNQGQPISVDVLANDSDANGDAMRVSRVDGTTAQGGTAIIINGGIEGGNNVAYTPVSGFNGTDSFTYDVTDDTDGTDTATVKVTVNPFTESSAGTVTLSQRLTATDIGVNDPATDASCVGGCTKFQVTGVPMGGQIEVLLPKLTSGVPDRFVFRQYVESTGLWKDYEAPDSVQTSAADPVTGLCPGLTGAYGPVTVGHRCVKAFITDEDGSGSGPNDDDPAGGTILDPIGFGQLPAAVPKENTISSSGCSINSSANIGGIGHWLLLIIFMIGLRRSHSNQKSRYQ